MDKNMKWREKEHFIWSQCQEGEYRIKGAFDETNMIAFTSMFHIFDVCDWVICTYYWTPKDAFFSLHLRIKKINIVAEKNPFLYIIDW